MKVKQKVWCDFNSLSPDNFFQAKLKDKLVRKTYANGQVVHYRARVPTPSKQFVRCPKCNKRLQLIHIAATDGNYLYIKSYVSKHKKWINKNVKN